MRLFAFDLETTGLDQQADRIMEFCFIELTPELEPVGEPWSALVNPERSIPAKVQEITSITPEMVADKKPFAHHAARIQKLVEGATLIAHNHRFDVPFLHNELVRAGQPGLPVDQPCIDTATIERVVNSHRLEATYERYTGKKMDGAHRSQADTEATVEVLRHQISNHKDVLGENPLELTQSKLAKIRDPEAQERTWLDHGHKFYRDADGVARFAFGKHRDEPVKDYEGFLNWMTSRDFPADTLACVQEFLKDIRGPSQERLA